MTKAYGTVDSGYSREMEEKVSLLEQETESKVSGTLSKIEEAIEAWKEAGNKPPDIEPKIRQLRNFHDELADWEKNSLLSSKGGTFEVHVENLREFVEICEKYKNVKLRGT